MVSKNGLIKKDQRKHKLKNTFDKNRFFSTAQRVYESWEKNQRGFENIHSFVAIAGGPETWYDMSMNAYSSAFVKWLTGLYLEGTLFFFTKTDVYIVCDVRLVKTLNRLVHPVKIGKVPKVKILSYNTQKMQETHYMTIIGLIRSIGNVGMFLDRKPLSSIDLLWNKVFGSSGIMVDVVDMATAFIHLSSAKDNEELIFIHRAAENVMNCWSEARMTLFDHIRQDVVVKRNTLTKLFESYATDLRIQKMLVEPDAQCSTVILSGKGCQKAEKKERQELHLNSKSDPISTIFLGSIQGYSAELSRTIFVNPSSVMKTAYAAILKVQRAVIRSLKPGKKLKDICEMGRKMLQANEMKLWEHSDKCFGPSVDLRPQNNPHFIIHEENEEVVLANMIFSVRVGLVDFPNESIKGKKGQPANVLIVDTVLVKAKGLNIVLTAKAPRDMGFNTILLDDDEQ